MEVTESDGVVRGLDVFGGFFDEDTLYLMGEIGTPFRVEWIRPLGECTLAGRTFPAPASARRTSAAPAELAAGGMRRSPPGLRFSFQPPGKLCYRTAAAGPDRPAGPTSQGKEWQASKGVVLRQVVVR